MAAMKNLAITLHNAGFDVDGSVTLAMVSRPKPNETPAERLHRLAAKALISGCRIVWPEGDGEVTRVGVTSASVSGLVYTVDVASGICGCEGSRRFGYCCHAALVAAEIGTLPDLPTPPAVAAEPVAA